MATSESKAVETPTGPTCDRCRAEMEPTGWVPKPDGLGGLRRLIVHRCPGCGRLYDQLWGHREPTGQL